MPANGKRKLPKGGVPGQAKRRKTQANGAPKRAVNVDALSWKTVDVPEMFDDAEGFYGLEVVEGVDIVKDIGGTVQFVSYSLPFLVTLRLMPISGDRCSCGKARGRCRGG